MKSLSLKIAEDRFDSLVKKGEAQYARDLFMWVVASVAVFGVNPRQALVNKCADEVKRAEVLVSWSRQGLIVGSPANWTFSNLFLKSVTQHFQLGRASFGSFSETNEAQIDLFVLVSEFRKGLKSKKEPVYPRIAAELRVLCKLYSPKEVRRLIRAFFKRHAKEYSMQSFSGYVAAYGRKR